MSTYLSKSDFKVARTCATKLYYRKLGYPSMLQDDDYLQFLADGSGNTGTFATAEACSHGSRERTGSGCYRKIRH